MRRKIMKDILLYLIMPEDTTESRGGMAVSPDIPLNYIWLGPLKTVFWIIVAVVGPLLPFAFWA